MASTKTNKVYAIFTGTGGKEVAIYVVKDIYDGLKSALGCQVLADQQSPPVGATIVSNIAQALENGVARIHITYTKAGRKQAGRALCSATNADTVLAAITSLKYRNAPIGKARFLG
jgi:hypothetical protein